jgi:hypothetical protein
MASLLITLPSVTYYGLIISVSLGTLWRHSITRSPFLLLQRRFSLSPWSFGLQVCPWRAFLDTTLIFYLLPPLP